MFQRTLSKNIFRKIHLHWLLPVLPVLFLFTIVGFCFAETAPAVADTANVTAPAVADTAKAAAPAATEAAKAAAPTTWFKMERLNVAVFLIIISVLVLSFLFIARSGKPLHLRRIAGLDALDEAIGRSAELGKPVLFVPGIGDVSSIQTIAALAILERVAKETATYDVELNVMTNYPLVMSTAQETVKQSYTAAGRPDLFNPNNIRYVTDNQFAFASAVAGHMVREQTAANFLLGEFYAESLIISEAGNSTGAIQIAGTAQPHQLPFFLASCDYTLMSEELFAASAYLTREPILLGTILGQDWSKAVFAAIMIGGIIAAVMGYEGYVHWFDVQ